MDREQTGKKDGELLQPTRSAAPIDASIMWKAGLQPPNHPSGNASGELWRADSWLFCSSSSSSSGEDHPATQLHFPQLLAADSGAWTLELRELLDDGEMAPVGGFVATEASSSGGTATALTESTPLALPRTDKTSFQLWSFAPRT
jgi:hypothetical protein